MAQRLDGVRVAILATDMVEESELTEPRQALETAGAETELIAPQAGQIMAAKHFDKAGSYEVDTVLAEADPADYDALFLPGGALNADQLRVLPEVQQFVRAFDADGRPIAAICHAPWLLVSAGLVGGRTLTSYHTLADDIRNAGGIWLDNAVVEDANWVSSRQPSDIPEFNEAMLDLYETSCVETELVTDTEFAFGERINEDEEE